MAENAKPIWHSGNRYWHTSLTRLGLSLGRLFNTSAIYVHGTIINGTCIKKRARQGILFPKGLDRCADSDLCRANNSIYVPVPVVNS